MVRRSNYDMPGHRRRCWGTCTHTLQNTLWRPALSKHCLVWWRERGREKDNIKKKQEFKGRSLVFYINILFNQCEDFTSVACLHLEMINWIDKIIFFSSYNVVKCSLSQVDLNDGQKYDQWRKDSYFHHGILASPLFLTSMSLPMHTKKVERMLPNMFEAGSTCTFVLTSADPGTGQCPGIFTLTEQMALKEMFCSKFTRLRFVKYLQRRIGFLIKKVKYDLNPLVSFVLAPLPECHEVFTQQILLSHKYGKETLTINMCNFEQWPE